MASRSRICVREHEDIVARHMYVHLRHRNWSYSEKFGSIVRGIMAVICMRRVVQDSDGTTSGAPPGAMATTEAWSGRGEKRLRGVAPQDMRGVRNWVVYLGSKSRSHHRHLGSRPQLRTTRPQSEKVLVHQRRHGRDGHFAFVEGLLASSAGGTCQIATPLTRIGAKAVARCLQQTSDDANLLSWKLETRKVLAHGRRHAGEEQHG